MNPTGIYPRKNFAPKKFESDPLNSTYRWELYLTPGYPGNKVGVLDGYSKGHGAEASNKVQLLRSKLVNPVLPYLKRCTEIVIFEQNAVLPKHMHKEILILKHDNFYPQEQWIRDTPIIMDFLTAYYTEYTKTGQMPGKEDRRKNVRQPHYFEELNHSNHTFQNLQELKDFCRSKVGRFSEQCMKEWYAIHAEFQPELFQTDDSNALKHMVNTASTYEAAQAAMSELHRKFTRS